MVPTPKQIRSFLAIARAGSFTRAAEEVGLSQPALTVQIHQLEETLGVKLFDRNKRQVRLTSAGKKLQSPLERVLIDLETVMNTGQDLAACKRGTVTVAALPSLCASLLPRAVHKFQEDHAGIDVQIHDVVADRVVQMVKSEEVEFGLGPRLTPDRAVAVEDFLTDRLCAFFPSDHPLSEGSLRISRLVEYPLILTGRNSSVRIMFERSLASEHAAIQIAGESNYMSTALGMVRAGLGVAILPASAAETGSTAGLSFRHIRAPLQMRKIGIIRKVGSSLSPACERFMVTLRQTAKEQPPSHFSLVPKSE